MYSDHFWLCLEALETALSGNSQQLQDTVEQYQKAWLRFSAARRAEIRQQLQISIRGLAQVETRLAEQDETQIQ
jgi:hypothetical protein